MFGFRRICSSQQVGLRGVRRRRPSIGCAVLFPPDHYVGGRTVAEKRHLLVGVFRRVLIEAVQYARRKGGRVQVLYGKRAVDPLKDGGVAVNISPRPDEDRIAVSVLPLEERFDGREGGLG